MAGHVFVLPVVQCIVTDVGDGMVVFSTHTKNKNKKSTLYVVRKNIGRKIYNVDPKYIMWTQKIQLATHQFCTSVTQWSEYYSPQHQPKLQQKRPVPQPIRVPRPPHSQRLHYSGVFQLPQDIWGFEGERQFFGVGLDAADEARTGLLHRFDQGGQLVLEKQEGREKDNFRKNVVRKIVGQK